MSYENRMYLRMALPWAIFGMFTILATWITTMLADVPLSLGAATSPLSDAPSMVAGIGAVITSSIGGWQLNRLWRWQHGKANDCMVCGCLMGSEYQAQWNVGRRCLGCRKFVPTR
jgi:hypothetical protein